MNQRNLLLYLSFVFAVAEVTQYYEPLFIRFGVQIAMIYIIWRKNSKYYINYDFDLKQGIKNDESPAKKCQ